MIEALLALPILLGGAVFMGLTTAVGMTVYYLTYQLYDKRQSDEAIKEINQATSNLMRVVGWLFTLLLSLTFTDVVGELSVTESAVEGEAVAIANIHHDLRRFGDASRDTRQLLVRYAETVVDHDWPALAGGKLSPQAEAAFLDLESAALDLEASNPTEELLRSRVIADVDKVDGFRTARLQQARENPPFVLTAVFVGYLVTMVYFGVYAPRRAFVGLLSLYTAFVGIVIYMILLMGAPFDGAVAVDTSPLQFVLEAMKEHADEAFAPSSQDNGAYHGLLVDRFS